MCVACVRWWCAQRDGRSARCINKTQYAIWTTLVPTFVPQHATTTNEIVRAVRRAAAAVVIDASPVDDLVTADVGFVVEDPNSTAVRIQPQSMLEISSAADVPVGVERSGSTTSSLRIFGPRDARAAILGRCVVGPVSAAGVILGSRVEAAVSTA